MSTSPQPRKNSSAPTVLLILGSVFMLLAVIFSVVLYIWGRSGPSYGENWNDVVSAIFIVYGGVPFFVIGLLLLVIGLVLRVRRKAASKSD
jgi:ABC-type methionine transport system permease subunit